MINTAPQGQNSVNGREKYVKAINFKLPTVQWSHGPVIAWPSMRAPCFALEEVGAQVQIPPELLSGF